MATTRIIPMHKNKGKSIAQCLRDRTKYAQNPEKTDGGALVSAFACDPKTADAEFLLAKREYRLRTGRTQERDVIAYQVRQSFKPGEITPEEANRVGYEFASRFLKEKHAFLVATHVDRAHIHNHIIWNSTDLACTRKFRNFWGSTKAVQRLSDTICIEHGLSVIENPKGKGMHYGKWLGDAKKQSHREQLRTVIDGLLEQKPADFDDLVRLLAAAGYEVKMGKRPSFRASGQKRFIRLDTLGEGYSREALTAVFADKRESLSQALPEKPESLNLLIDIQEKLRAGKGESYAKWAKKFNLKQMAQTMNYLTENGLTDYSELSRRAAEAAARYHALSDKIKSAEKELAEIGVLRAHILNYIKTREIYTAYRKAGYSAAFRAAHESEIQIHQAAKRAFDELGVDRLPTVKSLNARYAELLSSKKATYGEYRKVRDEMKALLVAKANVDKLLDEDSEHGRKKENERKPSSPR